MRLTLSGFFTAAVFLIASLAASQDLNSLGQNRLPQNFVLTPPRTGIIPGATVEMDGSGMVRRVRGVISVPGSRSAPEAAAKFLSVYHQTLQLSSGLSELGQANTKPSLTGNHVLYRQEFRGLPVFGGSIGVHLDPLNRVLLVNNDLKPFSIRGPFAVPTDSDGAVRGAEAFIGGLLNPKYPIEAVGGVFVESSNALGAWKLNLHTQMPFASWEIFVDAATNRVISYRNVLQKVSGSGWVFNPNPVQTSGIASLLYNRLAIADSRITAQEKSATLFGLDSSGYLDGQYATTKLSTTFQRAFSANHVYHYNYLQPQFEETMAYANCDAIERYIQSLGFSNIENRQIAVDVDGISDDNSAYDPATTTITFGSGGVPDGQDADILWHENGHAIQDNIVPGWGATHQGMSMGEGWGDYWAFSHEASIGGPNSPGWDVYIGKWDATAYNPGNPSYLRPLNSSKHFPEDMDYSTFDVHLDGEMWSVCLWQIWNLLGKTDADRLILESHFYLSTTAGFVDGAHAILKTNELLFGGKNQAAITKIFVDRGFLSSSDTDPGFLTYSVQGTTLDGSAPFPSVPYTLNANPVSLFTKSAEPGLAIPQGDSTTGITSSISMPARGTVTGVSVKLVIQHSAGGGVGVSLRNPEGAVVILKRPSTSDTSTTNIATTYPSLSVPAQSLAVFNGTNARGTWSLHVVDAGTVDTGYLMYWSITVSFANGSSLVEGSTLSDGTFKIIALDSGAYTIRPAKQGVFFTPEFASLQVGPSQSSVNFYVVHNHLSTLSLSSPSVLGGDSLTASVTLDTPAPPTNAVSVYIWSAGPIMGNRFCLISPGFSSGATPITFGDVSVNTNANLYARLGATTLSRSVTVVAAPRISALTLNYPRVKGGVTVTATISLASPAPLPMKIAISSSDPHAPVTSTVMVGQGSARAFFSIKTASVQSDTSAFIGVHRGSNKASAPLTILR